MSPELREALANELSDLADELEAQAAEHPFGDAPLSQVAPHEQIKQMRRDARFIRARAVALRNEGLNG